MKTWTQREAHIAAVLEYAKARLPRAEQAAMLTFIQAVYKAAAPDDVVARSVENLYGIALSLWKFAAKRQPGTAKTRVFNPTIEEHGWHTTHTVIQMVNDDMPFLVDSVTGNLAAGGTEVHFVVHPMIDVVRDKDGNRADKNGALRESLIHLEIDRKTSPEVLAALKARIDGILTDVKAAVTDWTVMQGKITEAATGLTKAPKSAKAEDVQETQAFLEWLADYNFTILGYRHYDHSAANSLAVESYGVLRDQNRHIFRKGGDFIAVSDEIRDFLKGPDTMLVTKANVKSTVHRPVHMDYVGVKIFGDKGTVVGEHRFVGLFTSSAYNRRAQTIPYLRQKVARVLARAEFDPASHDGKALTHILETFPRDELFQTPENLLFETALGILYLLERPHARAFLRQDKYGRFVSALVYVPRDLYESNLRNRIEAILCDAYKGEISARHANLSDDVIARWHFIIRTKPDSVPVVNADDINLRIAQVARGWRDQLKEALVDRVGEEKGVVLFDRYNGLFPAIYRDAFSPELAIGDIEKLESIAGPEDVQYNFYRRAEDTDDVLRLKIYHPSRVIPLSDCMPLLENLGFRVIEEFAYDLEFPYGDQIGGCIHNFYLRDPQGTDIVLTDVKQRLEDTLKQATIGAAENDGFNALVLRAGLTWLQVMILRAYARYLRQLNFPYSEDYLRSTLADNPAIVRNLVSQFETRFDPSLDEKARVEATERLQADIQAMLEDVQSLDQDRILRSFRNVVHATLRTNHYQHDRDGNRRPALALKISSRDVKDAPLPQPFAEIFVYAPRVEGVHLRFGSVARGGLRWSDRPEDFRTEVLGLVKAQQVKNAVIVPVGAKGGFYPKQMPKDGDRDAVLAEGVACYKIFISTLLDVTDNLVNNAVVPPQRVVRHDGDDPYLVVAADKGTATFSDYANGLAQDRGFWLDDAFASGGSHGYDHKKMGITARGAWISVERHFRERGVDLANESITVVGIGDMSGDVFGNGMLLSQKIALKAAFDHRHIFLDPAPNEAKSYVERKRLFDLPRSSWMDFDNKLISKGGGVYDRKAKSIVVGSEVAGMLGIEEGSITPNDLIQAILRAEVDLLWIGGIGTYVKAASENNRDVGDRSNDAVRVNGETLRCRVVGEGGNLGFTQAGRIAYAKTGGAINTDSIDNSAGVNCSDHEVNIKILLNGAINDGSLAAKDRDDLLVEMTQDVSALVLDHNYLQSLSITLADAVSTKALDSQSRLLAALEKSVGLNRVIEGLPTDDVLIERQVRNEGLTRPELAIIVSYSKMALKQALLRSSVVDDRYLEADLISAFPEQLGQRFKQAMLNHRLRREIIATVLANQVVNRFGPGFVQAIVEKTECDPADVVRAYVIVRDVYNFSDLWRAIDRLDGQVSSAIQTLLYLDVSEFAAHFVTWVLRRLTADDDIAAVVGRLRPGVEAMIAAPYDVLQGSQFVVLQQKISMYRDQGVDDKLASRIAGLEAHESSGDVAELAAQLGRPVADVAKAYFFVGATMGYNWLRNNAENIASDDHWERLATAAIVDDLFDQQRRLTERLLTGSKTKDGAVVAKAWADANDAVVKRVDTMLAELGNTQITLSKLGYAARHLSAVLLR